MKRVLPGVVLTLLTAALPTAVQTATLTTPTIASRTVAASLSCMRWRPVGVCFWGRRSACVVAMRSGGAADLQQLSAPAWARRRAMPRPYAAVSKPS